MYNTFDIRLKSGRFEMCLSPILFLAFLANRELNARIPHGLHWTVWNICIIFGSLQSRHKSKYRAQVVPAMQTYLSSEIFESPDSRLTWNSHVLSATLTDSRALSSNLNLLNFFLESRWEFSLIWPGLAIVAESWRKLLWEPTLSNSHPHLADVSKNLTPHPFLCPLATPQQT